MQFETERLLIRPWEPALDARHALDIFGDARVMAWVDSADKDLTIRQAQGRLQRYCELNRSVGGRKTGSWAVVQKDICRVIGHVVLMMLPDMREVRTRHVVEPIEGGLSTDFVEIGWQFRPASWGYGYATEAARQIVRCGFEQWQLPQILSVTQPENRRSIGVINRLEMQYCGVTTRFYGGEPLSLYRLTAEEFAMQTVLKSNPEQLLISSADSLVEQGCSC